MIWDVALLRKCKIRFVKIICYLRKTIGGERDMVKELYLNHKEYKVKSELIN